MPNYTRIGFLLMQLIWLGLLLLWPVLSIIALVGLRDRTLTDVAKALWAAIVVAVPLLGAVAFWIVGPGTDIEV
jgi:hypothetical protein